MSPLLSVRAPVSVNARLLAACAVTAGLAALVALSAGGRAETSAAVPVTLAIGAVCAALVAHLLHASARAVTDHRLRWIAAGVTVALAGLVAAVLGQPALFPDGGLVDQGADAAAARYLIWHAALLTAGALALAGVRARPKMLVGFTAGGVALLAYASLSPAPLGDLTAADGAYQPALRIVVALLAAGQLAVAAAWWRRAEGAPTWGEVCVIALTALSGLDAAAYLFADGGVRRRVVGQPHAARRPVRDPRRRPRDRLRRRRRPAARAAGGARPRPRGRARARRARGGDRRPRPPPPRAGARADRPARRRRRARRRAAADLRARQRRRRRRRGARALHGRPRRAAADRGDVPRRPRARPRHRARAGRRRARPRPRGPPAGRPLPRVQRLPLPAHPARARRAHRPPATARSSSS